MMMSSRIRKHLRIYDEVYNDRYSLTIFLSVQTRGNRSRCDGRMLQGDFEFVDNGLAAGTRYHSLLLAHLHPSGLIETRTGEQM